MSDPRVASVLLAALACSVAFGQAPQGPRQGGPPEGGTAAVLIGRVVDADTGEPIAEASVALSGRPAPAPLFGEATVTLGGETRQQDLRLGAK